MTEKKHEKLPEEVFDVIKEAMSQYFEQDLQIIDVTTDSCEPWRFELQTKWMYSNRGIFRSVISKYYFDMTVIRHQFDSDGDKYRNGKVYRIYPHVHWEHYNRGSNGHETEPSMIVIEKVMNFWDIRTTLNN
jgi:hypothetical protein